MKSMNKVICYSAMHTGTWFLIRLLETSTEKWTDVAGDANLTRKGRPYKMEECPVSSINKQWYRKNIEQYFPNLEQEKELIVIHGHHFSLISKFPKTIADQKPTIPIVIPLRDPLKAVVSLCWRRYKDYDRFITNSSEEERIGRADVHLERIKQLIKISSENAFLFPIDLYDKSSKEEKEIGRNTQVRKLFNFCSLPITKKTKKYLKRWTPQNTTSNWTLPNKGMATPPKDPTFMKIAKMLDRNNKDVKSLIEIEYNRAHSDTELIDLLKQVGYRSLTWW
jgi:hypothetical protein